MLSPGLRQPKSSTRGLMPLNQTWGSTTWDGAGRGRKLIMRDVEISKNYLNHEEIKDLESLVDQYLDFAERQARHRKVMYMADWKAKLDAFLESATMTKSLLTPARSPLKRPKSWLFPSTRNLKSTAEAKSQFTLKKSYVRLFKKS